MIVNFQISPRDSSSGRRRRRLFVAIGLVLCRSHSSLVCHGYNSVVSSSSSSFVIKPKTWLYKNSLIGYEESRVTNGEQHSDYPKEEEPVLLLNGFGVGSFHQHRLIRQLLANSNLEKDVVGGNNKEQSDSSSSSSSSRIVYGVDYLGQGRSWPVGCDDGNAESERGLIYSIDTWADQIIDFIQEVILPEHGHHHDVSTTTTNGETQQGSTKVHLVGNSVGGHLSVILAARRPDLIRSITLLNATPVWGLNLPGWSGRLPPPALPRRLGRFLFDRIRDLGTIETYLTTAYAKREAFDDELMKQIRSCTEGGGGHAAFASILWSPPATISEDDAKSKADFSSKLSRVSCDVLLIYGKDDPWCKPAFAVKILQTLKKRQQQQQPSSYYDDPSKIIKKPIQRYVELTNVGHCPNHEAPTAVADVVSRWIASRDGERGKDQLILVDGDGGATVVKEPWGDIEVKEVDDGDLELGFMDRIVTNMMI